jgi:secreted PhoX family phosphatase
MSLTMCVVQQVNYLTFTDSKHQHQSREINKNGYSETHRHCGRQQKWVNTEESQTRKPYKWDPYYPADPYGQDENQEMNLKVTNCNNTYM